MKSTDAPSVIPPQHAAWCGWPANDHQPTECLNDDWRAVIGANDYWNDEPEQRSVDCTGWKTSLQLGLGRDPESPDGYKIDVLPGISPADGSTWSEQGQHVELTLAAARELRDHLNALIELAEADAEVAR